MAGLEFVLNTDTNLERANNRQGALIYEAEGEVKDTIVEGTFAELVNTIFTYAKVEDELQRGVKRELKGHLGSDSSSQPTMVTFYDGEGNQKEYRPGDVLLQDIVGECIPGDVTSVYMALSPDSDVGYR